MTRRHARDEWTWLAIYRYSLPNDTKYFCCCLPGITYVYVMLRCEALPPHWAYICSRGSRHLHKAVNAHCAEQQKLPDIAWSLFWPVRLVHTMSNCISDCVIVSDITHKHTQPTCINIFGKHCYSHCLPVKCLWVGNYNYWAMNLVQYLNNVCGALIGDAYIWPMIHHTALASQLHTLFESSTFLSIECTVRFAYRPLLFVFMLGSGQSRCICAIVYVRYVCESDNRIIAVLKAVPAMTPSG